MGTWTTTPRTWVAGEVPTAAMFNANLRDFGRAFSDAFVSYTPTLTASTTNPTGWTQTGYYTQVGKLVLVKFKLTAGASMTAGTGAYRMALPVAANVTIGTSTVGGVVEAWDNSLSSWGTPKPLIRDSASSVVAFMYPATWPTGTQTEVGAAAPWTWAANDFLRGAFWYEAA